MTAGDAGARRYARRIEGALEERAGTPVVLSPRDWNLLSDWFERGVPLEIVVEALEDAASRGARRRQPSMRLGLTHVAAAVEQAYRLVLDGRATVPEAMESPLPSLDALRVQWSRVAAAAGAGSPLHRAISRGLDMLEREELVEDVDRALDDLLLGAAPDVLLESAREACEVALLPFRARMGKETFEATFRRGVADRLRRTLGLPRATLTQRVR